MSPIVQLPDKSTPEWVAVREVAERCGISMQVCRTLLARAEIPVRRFGRTLKVRRGQAEEFVGLEGAVEQPASAIHVDEDALRSFGRGPSRHAHSSASRSSGPNS